MLAAGWNVVLNVMLRKVRSVSSPGLACVSGRKKPPVQKQSFQTLLPDFEGMFQVGRTSLQWPWPRRLGMQKGC